MAVAIRRSTLGRTLVDVQRKIGGNHLFRKQRRHVGRMIADVKRFLVEIGIEEVRVARHFIGTGIGCQ